MTSQSILVTGGAGYIGAHTLVELVASGYTPVVLDDLSRSSMKLMDGVKQLTGKQLSFYQVDCADKTELRRVFGLHPEISAVMHFAAFKSVNESVEKPLLYFRNNIDSLLSLLEVMQEANVNRFVFSSSCTVYGQPDRIPVTEDAPFKRPESPYGATKQMGERILEDAVKAWKELKVVSLRYFNPIGAHPSGVIGELPIGVPNNLAPYITQTAIGKRSRLTVFGSDYNTPDGSCLRDFIHVVDLAVAHVAALSTIDQLPSRFEAFNLGTGVPVSVLELLNTFMRVTGVNVPYEIGPRRPGDIEKVYADPSKSNRALRWRTKLTIEDALRDAWRWEQNLAK
ncbi:MAG: UDP-glucose 4-epimerase GalE [Cyclobacteriaceae bacterium]|nr:UDP-glucose 4-epimerase GalE [Cyclobacteriaceae bacterium]